MPITPEKSLNFISAAFLIYATKIQIHIEVIIYEKSIVCTTR